MCKMGIDLFKLDLLGILKKFYHLSKNKLKINIFRQLFK